MLVLFKFEFNFDFQIEKQKTMRYGNVLCIISHYTSQYISIYFSSIRVISEKYLQWGGGNNAQHSVKQHSPKKDEKSKLRK